MAKKQIGNEETFLDACVVEHDWFYAAAQLDDLDPEEYRHTRMTGFSGHLKKIRNSNGWYYHDVELHVMSVCVKKKTSTHERRLIALSREGDVEIYSGLKGTEAVEKIPGAGLQPTKKRGGIAGYVTNIREIGTSLYVCGLSGQVYKRPAEGGWIAIDEGLFCPLTAKTFPKQESYEPPNFFTCIDGNAEDDIYVVGLQGTVFHYNGEKWQKVNVPTDQHLQWMRCYGKDEVYICGYDGVLLKGSVHQGFVDVSSADDGLIWWSLCKFKNKVYLSSTSGLYVWDGTKIEKVRSGLSPEIETYRLDKDGEELALWSFGTKDITCFDGMTWKRLDHPDNPKFEGGS